MRSIPSFASFFARPPVVAFLGLVLACAGGSAAFAGEPDLVAGAVEGQVRFIPLRADASADAPRPVVRVAGEDDAGVEMEFELPGLLQADVSLGERSCTILGIEQGGFEGEPGAPTLPTFSRLVRLPDRGGARVEVLDVETAEIEGLHLAPMQPDEPGDFVPEGPAYLRAGYPAGARVVIGEPAVMRNLRVAPVTFRPVRFDPLAGKVEVARRIRLRVVYTEDAAPNPKAARQAKTPASFDAVYRQLVVNYAGPRDGGADGLGSYVIVCPNSASVLSTLQELVDWRRRKGHEVYVATTAETGTTTTSIQTWLRNAYATWENPPEYIALVGDGDASAAIRIPAWSYNGGDTDLPYAQLEGGDLLPDAHVGRISVRDVDQLDVYVHKIVGYESTPYLDDTSWYTRACVVGDPTYSGYTCVQIGQWMKSRLRAHGYTQVDTVFTGPFESQMIAALNRGDTAFMYRGFGGMSNFDAGDARAIMNGRKMNFSSQITCGTNSFSQDIETVCEAWIRSGTVSAPRGGVGAIGASTSSTHTRYNNCATYGIWGGVYNEDLYTFGAANSRGKLELYLNYSVGDMNGAQNFCHWINLMGDPAGEIWTGVPQTIAVSHPASLALGANAVTASVSSGGFALQGATVCLYKEGEVHVAGRTGADGTVELPVGAPSAGPLTITVTGHDLRPYAGAIAVAQQTRFVGYAAHAVDDDASGSSTGNGDGVPNPGERIELRVAVRNSGSQEVDDIAATLTASDPYVTIVDAVEAVPNLQAGASAWCLDDFDLVIAGGAPNGHRLLCDLDVASGTDIWRSLIELEVVAPEFVYDAVTLYDVGTRLDPGEAGGISVRVANHGGAGAAGASGRLVSHSTWLVVTDSLGVFPAAPVGATVENTADRFGVVASASCFQGHVAALSLILETAGGACDTVTLAVTIGQRSSVDPTGPDGYGYYAFDNTDTAYSEAPAYAWLEIDPRYGGQGVSAGLYDNSDESGDSEVFQLPFAFTFYGHTFHSVTICSNGWIAMGSTPLSNYNNWTIPGVGAPPYLIAPKWDGLYQSGDDRVYYWADTAGHRFVVQWSRLRNDATGATENFEVILYDPLHYPTQTGDGMIVFQYDLFNIGDFTHHYWTTGIENGDQSDGVLYSFFNSYTGGSATIATGRAIKFLALPQVPYGRLSGFVSNATQGGGAGVPEATITLLGRGIASADQEGSYFVNSPVGTYTVVAAHPSFAPDTVADVAIVRDQTTVLDFALVDDHAPAMLNTTDYGLTCDPAGPYPIESTVIEYSTIEELTLTYNIAGAGWITVPMAPVSGDLYRAAIPGAPYGSLIKYYLRARDNGGNAATDPAGAPEITYSFWVLPPIYIEGMEQGASGWTHYIVQGGFRDSWHLSAVRNHTPAGTWSWKFGATGVGGTYLGLSDGALQSPAFTLDGDQASLTFWHWMAAESIPASPGEAYDGGLIEMSVNGGAWTRVTPVAGYTHIIRTGLGPGPFPAGTPVFSGSFAWRQDEIDLAGVSGSVRVRFRFGSDNAVQMEGWYIDDIVVMNSHPGPATSETVHLLPARVALHAGRPNPFGRESGRTALGFDLPRPGAVQVSILDVAGRLVAPLIDATLPAGRHEAVWTGRDARGRTVESGVYFCVLRVAGEERTRRVLVVR